MPRLHGLLVSVALLAAGCVSMTAARGRESSEVETAAETGSGGTAVEGGPSSARRTRQAILDAIGDVKGSSGRVAVSFRALGAHGRGIGGANGAFSRYTAFGRDQLQWLNGALADSAWLVIASAEIADPDMELGILRMTGPRIQAAMFGTILLAAWMDFLSLADVVLQQFRFYGVESLFMDMSRVQKLIEPSMAALASQDPEQVEATAAAMPELMGKLTHEFDSLRERVRLATETGGQVVAVAQLVEMLTMMSAMKIALLRLPPPPAAPVALGSALVMGSSGVMMGSQVVVSAEWVEMVRRLVQAGVISFPAVSAAVRIHAGQVMMTKGGGDLPQGVRDALGDGPEVRAMHQTGRAGAGMSEAPRHHVLPTEHRAWFEARGFRGAMDIDKFCVRMEQAHHQAIHGGGNWRLGRTSPGEWNRRITDTLRSAESQAGRMLTRNDILNAVAKLMKEYSIPMSFVSGRRR